MPRRPKKHLHKKSSQFPTRTTTQSLAQCRWTRNTNPGKPIHLWTLFLWFQVNTQIMVPSPDTTWNHPKSPLFIHTPTKTTGTHMPIWKFWFQLNFTCRPQHKNNHPWNLPTTTNICPTWYIRLLPCPILRTLPLLQMIPPKNQLHQIFCHPWISPHNHFLYKSLPWHLPPPKCGRHASHPPYKRKILSLDSSMDTTSPTPTSKFNKSWKEPYLVPKHSPDPPLCNRTEGAEHSGNKPCTHTT